MNIVLAVIITIFVVGLPYILLFSLESRMDQVERHIQDICDELEHL